MATLNKNQQLFRKLTDQFNDYIYKLADKEIDKLLLNEKATRDEFLDYIGRVVLSYNTEDNSLNLTGFEKAKLNKELNKKITELFQNEYSKENNSIESILMGIGKDKYNTSSFLYGLGLDFTLKKVSDKALKGIINKTVRGENYSDLIWKNKNLVAKQIKTEVKKFVDGETNLNRIEKIIKQKFNNNAFNTKRLVQTETARVMEGVNSQWQEDNNIEWVMASATLDNDTCGECGELDGKTFKRTDSNKPDYPLHPFCRCTLVSVPSEDWKPRQRMDNVTKEVIDYKTYEEWKEKNKL